MLSVGPNNPGTTGDDASIGTWAWATTDNAKVHDGNYAVVGVNTGTASHYLTVTNFGFNIPVNAAIRGVLVEVEKNEGGAGNNVFDFAVRLIVNGVIGSTDRSLGTEWPAADAYVSYGGTLDDWGTLLTPTLINQSNFGFAISGWNNVGGGSGLAVNHIRMTVYYDLPGDLSLIF